MKRKFLFMTGVAVAAAAVLLLTLGGAGRTPDVSADNYDYGWDVVLCDGAGGANDPIECVKAGVEGSAADNGGNLGIIEPGDNPEVQSHLRIDVAPFTNDVAFFALANTVWKGITTAAPGAITEGAVVGETTFSIGSSATIANQGTSYVNAGTGQPDVCGMPGTIDIEASPFKLYMGELDAGDGVDNDSDGRTDEEILNTEDDDADGRVDEDLRSVSYQDDDDNGKAQEFEDNVGADCVDPAWGGSGPNGIFDGVDCIPEPLFSVILPQYEATLGDPTARAFGKACVLPSGDTCALRVPVNFLVYDYDYDGDSTNDANLSFTLVLYPGMPSEKPSPASVGTQGVLTCTPFVSNVRIFGMTTANNAACHECDGSPDPSIAGGVVNRTAGPEGTYPYQIAIELNENPDGDLAAEEWETCSTTVSTDTDLAPAHTDPDIDRWDSACDPYPASPDNDNDGNLLNYNAPPSDTWPMDPDNCNIAGYGFVGGWDCDQDVDGDGWLNTVDNCPFTPQGDVTEDGMENGLGPVTPGTGDCYDGVDNGDGDGLADHDDPDCADYIDWQQDTDGDNVGDVCDTTAPDTKGDGSGYVIDARPHGLVGGIWPAGDTPGYHKHDDLCNDEFVISAAEPTGGGVCAAKDSLNPVIDSDGDGDPDWFDANANDVYDIRYPGDPGYDGDPIDTDADEDQDGHTDACESVVGTDPLEAASAPGAPSVPDPSPDVDDPSDGDCDGDGTIDRTEEKDGTNPFPIPWADIAVDSFTANDPPAGYPDPAVNLVHYILPISSLVTVTLEEIKHNYGPDPTVADVTWEATGFNQPEVNIRFVPELGDECTFDGAPVSCVTGGPGGDINDLHFEVELLTVSEDVLISRDITFHCKVPGRFTGQLINSEVPAAGQPEDPDMGNNSATIDVIIDCVVAPAEMDKVIVSISSAAEDQIAHPGAVVNGDEVWNKVNDPPPEAAGDPLPDGVPPLPHADPPRDPIEVKPSENFTLITNDLDWSENDVWIDKTATLTVIDGNCEIGDFEAEPFDEPKPQVDDEASQVINEFEPEGYSVQPEPLLWDVHLVDGDACTLGYTLAKAPKPGSPFIFPPPLPEVALTIPIAGAACEPPLVDLGLPDADSDCDGAPDDDELGPIASSCGTRDPNDPWDFYNVPVPTLGRGGAMSDRDSAVTILSDVLGVLEYSGTSDNGPPNSVPRDYDDDIDGDGYDDGLAYDRSVGATWSGAPDGNVIILTDVLLVLAQSGHGC